MSTTNPAATLFDPDRWGLPAEAVATLGERLYTFWDQFRPCFRTRTRDPSSQAYTYLRGQLTMEDQRNFANVARRVNGDDGQALQQFMSDSPWAGQAVFHQIQTEIQTRAELQHGAILVLDESADEKAGIQSAGAGRQHNGCVGKVDICQVATCLAYAHPQTNTWALVDAELFLPAAWFTPDYAERREQVGVPKARPFATKVELGLQMIRRVRQHGLPFEFVACDDLYGRNRAFRATLAADGIQYAAEVPADSLVYLNPPRVGLPHKRHRHGRSPTSLKVLSRQKPREVRQLARHPQTVWQHVSVRHTERGHLEADFAVRRLWTLTEQKQGRAEWLVIRRDADGKCTFVLLNAPADTLPLQLIERSCQRYFTERTFQDAKSELGWDDFQAQKYRAWEHHTALTAAALWFVAQVKLDWRETYERDPALARQLQVEVLPALSTANVRELLQAVLPLPQLTQEQARYVIATHLVNRARSTRSRLQSQQEHDDSS